MTPQPPPTRRKPPLPPPSPPSSPNIDHELYAIVSLLVRDHILPWYTKLSPSPDFIVALTTLLTHILAALVTRVQAIDVEELLLEDLPAILSAHINGCLLTS
jgi:hypothetical protein